MEREVASSQNKELNLKEAVASLESCYHEQRSFPPPGKHEGSGNEADWLRRGSLAEEFALHCMEENRARWKN